MKIFTSSLPYWRSSLPRYSLYAPLLTGDSCVWRIQQRLLLKSTARRQTVCNIFLWFWLKSYLISPGPFDLGSEVLHSLVQASVAAQLGLHRGQIRAPLGFINTMLVFLHPGQEVLDVAKGHVVQLRPHLHGLLGGLLHGDLDGGHSSLQTEVVIAAQVHQTLIEAVNPVKMRNTVLYTLYSCFFFSSVFLKSFLSGCITPQCEHPPAVHLFSLRVAPILENLHIIEEQVDHVFCLVQLPLHLCCVLSWLTCAQQTDVLRGWKQY